jgi:hypothetical protein
MSRLRSIRQRHRVEPVVPAVIRAALRLCCLIVAQTVGSYLTA